MTVQDLINKLNEFDPNKNVFILSPDDNPMNNGMEIEDVFTITGSKDEYNNAVYIMEG